MAGILRPSTSVSFRQHPRASVDIRGMCGRKMKDGSCKITTKTAKKFHKCKTLGRGGQNIAPVSFRQRPRTSVYIRGMCGRKMKDGICKIMTKTEKNRHKWQKLGRVAEILLPPASVSCRGRPWTSAACVDGRWKMEAVKLCGETQENHLNGRN